VVTLTTARGRAVAVTTTPATRVFQLGDSCRLQPSFVSAISSGERLRARGNWDAGHKTFDAMRIVFGADGTFAQCRAQHQAEHGAGAPSGTPRT
jgi:hypothetical protein